MSGTRCYLLDNKPTVRINDAGEFAWELEVQQITDVTSPEHGDTKYGTSSYLVHICEANIHHTFTGKSFKY